MFRRRLLSSLALLATVGCTAVVLGQQPPAALPGPPTPVAPIAPLGPLYKVEVLIFAHRDFDRTEERLEHGSSPGEAAREQALRQAPVFDDSNFGPLGDGAAAPGAETPLVPAEPGPFRYRLLRPDELQLANETRVIGRLPAYQLLVHGGWVQAGLPEDQALRFDLSMLGALNPRGTIQVYLSRFLHVDLDLSYQDPQSRAAPAAPVGGNDLSLLEIAPRYRLRGERQVRSGELHYFDHPAFGVLVKITPVPADAATTGSRPAA